MQMLKNYIALVYIPRTSESEIACRGVRCIRRAGCHAVAIAVGIMAEIGSAAVYSAFARFRADGIVARSVDVKVGTPPVEYPLPNIACHVV